MKHFLIIAIIFITGINIMAKDTLKIVISKAEGSDNYLKYEKWIKGTDKRIQTISLYSLPLDSALAELKSADGLFLSGGPDVHPNRYNKPQDSSLCYMDLQRDTLEFALIEAALKLKMPILAVCRGEQVMNVALGGDLISDIPSQAPGTIRHGSDSVFTATHEVKIAQNSQLHRISGVTKLVTNSFHHQAIGRVAEPLKIIGKSADGIVEAVQWKNARGKSYLLAVQWHPERMPSDDKLSNSIRKAFLGKVASYSKKKKTS